MESREEKLLHAIFGESEPKAKALKFSLNLDDLTVDVSIRRNKKTENQTCECSKGCKCGGKSYGK